MTLNDSAVLQGGADPTGSITFSLVGPGGGTVDFEMVSVNGDGTYATPTGYTPSGPRLAGTYQWNATYNGDANNNPASDVDDPAEQVTVNAASPTLSSTPNPSSATLGPPVTLHDAAFLQGGADPTGSIIFNLVGPGGGTVDTEFVSVDGNGLYSTPTGYTPSGPVLAGTYQWNATYNGDANNNPASDVDDPAEQVTVNAASPTLSTEPNPSSAPLGPPVILHDAAFLQGGSDPTGSITFSLVGPDGTTVDTEAVLVDGNGLYATPTGYTPSGPVPAGTYQWNATYSGDANNNPASDVDDPAEQVTLYQLVAADQTSVSAPENAAATNTGTFSDQGGAVTLTASSGTLSQDDADGTWSWSGTGDEDDPYTVTVTATNTDGDTVTVSFDVSFTDVPPTVAADQARVSAPVDTAATNTGTYSDYDDAVWVSGPGVTDNDNGTWSWSGIVTAAPYTVTVTATNADGSTSTTTFTVDPSVSITSSAAATFHVGTPGTFTVTTTGVPIPALSGDGSLPAGVTFTDDGDGTATLTYDGRRSTPGGLYPITIDASNGLDPPAEQDFGLTMLARPVVSSSGSNAGPVGGGQSIVITGSNFVPGASVVIGQGHGAGLGALPATDVDVVSSTEITATTGGGARAGTWRLFVVTAGGTSAGIAYQYGPGVTSVTPDSGPVSGGQSIVITGSNFVPGASVVIAQGHGAGPSAIPVTDVDVVSSTEITATTGGGARPGTWKLFVTTSGGTSPVTAGSWYHYQ